MRTVAALALAAIALPACADVPVLTFAEAGADVGSISTDAAASPPDAAPAAGCPGPVPPAGASVCCGAVPCNGDCAGRCPECEATCASPGMFCCAKTNNILCRPSGSTCN